LSAGRGGIEESRSFVEAFLRGSYRRQNVEAFGDVDNEPFEVQAIKCVVDIALGLTGLGRGERQAAASEARANAPTTLSPSPCSTGRTPPCREIASSSSA
jgi:hypothetical protein